jgi:putative DNA primase/helicase
MRFEEALLMAGLRPRDIVADGRIRRCPTEAKPGRRNGWYVLHADGRGAWGDWTSGGGEALGHWTADAASIRPVDTARLQAQRERERAHRLQAIRSARAFWERARPLARPHPYIEKKGLSQLGCAGLRQHDGLLVVPVLWRGRLISVQTITVDGEKRFWPGAPVKGGCCALDRRRAAITALVEGLATGLAVFQAVRQAHVVVAFDADNLTPVVDLLRPTGSVVIAADNDHGTQARRGFNPGREKAQSAAELIGCGVVWPEGINGSDWADYLIETGHGACRKAERLIAAAARYVAPSGPVP